MGAAGGVRDGLSSASHERSTIRPLPCNMAQIQNSSGQVCLLLQRTGIILVAAEMPSRPPHAVLPPMHMCSAHWCPPCRGFTPVLAGIYSAFKASHARKDDFSVVFVSSDREPAAFDEYFKDMPWLALPYAERDLKARLSAKFKVGEGRML